MYSQDVGQLTCGALSYFSFLPTSPPPAFSLSFCLCLSPSLSLSLYKGLEIIALMLFCEYAVFGVCLALSISCLVFLSLYQSLSVCLYLFLSLSLCFLFVPFSPPLLSLSLSLSLSPLTFCLSLVSVFVRSE